ncbi:MAG TPA: hypothetical protein PKJ79_20365, partial [Quisquiliibacterium sp.]|nr:hypothetical protein [Quisquiliibacterium sp.]
MGTGEDAGVAAGDGLEVGGPEDPAVVIEVVYQSDGARRDEQPWLVSSQAHGGAWTQDCSAWCSACAAWPRRRSIEIATTPVNVFPLAENLMERGKGSLWEHLDSQPRLPRAAHSV